MVMMFYINVNCKPYNDGNQVFVFVSLKIKVLYEDTMCSYELLIEWDPKLQVHNQIMQLSFDAVALLVKQL
jgi:hypothetical protein